MKHIRKMISALILFTEMSALYILIPHITDPGLRNAFFTPARAVAVILACIIGFFLFLFINIFPRFTVRKVSGRRNQILEDGAALLQLFLTTTVAEFLFAVLYSLFMHPEGTGIGYGAGRLLSLLLLVLMESCPRVYDFRPARRQMARHRHRLWSDPARTYLGAVPDHRHHLTGSGI